MYQCLDCKFIFKFPDTMIFYNHMDDDFDCCPKCGGEELIKINEDPETASR
jgi:rRNA maturation endonuclease Nob1